MTNIDGYRRLFEYEQHAHHLVMAALRAVPDNLRTTPQIAKAGDMMSHIIGARLIWLFRLGTGSPPAEGFFPQAGSLDALERRMNAMHQVWSAYLAELSDEDLKRPFEYEDTEGGAFRSVLEDVLTQLYGHSLYHRGQIAMLLRQAGAQPPETDFIFWAREAV